MVHRMFQISGLGIWLAWSGIAAAQTSAPTPLTLLQQEAEKRTLEWTALASGLEVRLVRLLPCDPRVRGAVEEVSWSSEARVAAWNVYWQAVSVKSKDQLEAARKLAVLEDARAAAWGQGRLETEAEHAAIEAQASALTLSTRALPAFANAQRTLGTLTQLERQSATQAQDRDTVNRRLTDEVRDLVTSAEARQKNLDAQLKARDAEASAWRTYYAARTARAQTECTITNAAAAPRGESRPARKKKQ